MDKPDLKISGLTVVVVGRFIPTIYHPSWLAAKKLIPQAEADAAKVEIVSSEVALLRLEWCTLTITDQRFAAESGKADKFPVLMDLVYGILGLTAETPLTAVGINRNYHYAMDSNESWHAVGDKLAPKGPWEGLLEKPGMLAVRMQGQRTDNFKGSINVLVEPSTRIANGVYIQVNDHYDLQSSKNSEEAIEILTTQFESFVAKADKISIQMVTL